MKKISKRIKYDFTIYLCLILALALIGYSGYTYLDNQSYSLKEILNPQESTTVQEEPYELKEIDKKEIIKKYLLDIIDEIKTDKTLSSKNIIEWKAYEIMSIYYDRKIANNYHAYVVNIKVSNINNSYPDIENKELSTNKYKVLTLTFNIVKDPITSEYTVKSIDIPKNS